MHVYSSALAVFISTFLSVGPCLPGVGSWGADTDSSTHYPGSQTTSSSATASAMGGADVSDSTSTVMSDVAPRRTRDRMPTQGSSAG